jgi:hypothetical protein
VKSVVTFFSVFILVPTLRVGTMALFCFVSSSLCGKKLGLHINNYAEQIQFFFTFSLWRRETMKRLTSCCLPVIALVLLSVARAVAQTATAPAAGDGSSGNPYQIASLENLYWIAVDASRWNKHYIQTANQ